MTHDPIKAGDHFEMRHPFVLDVREGQRTWRRGVRREWVTTEEAEAIADGLGKQLIHVISVHKPGRYQERVFFLQTWKDPDGKHSGNDRLRDLTTDKFRKLLDGRPEDYRVIAPPLVLEAAE